MRARSPKLKSGKGGGGEYQKRFDVGTCLREINFFTYEHRTRVSCRLKIAFNTHACCVAVNMTH